MIDSGLVFSPCPGQRGWFGPRGLALIVFAVIIEDAHLPHSADIATVTYLTVGLSMLVHGSRPHR